MDFLESLKFAPKVAVFLLPPALALLAFAFFRLLKKQKKEEPEPIVFPLAEEGAPPPPRKGRPQNFLLILTTFLLLTSLPMAVFLVKQRQEIRMRAEEVVLHPTPTPEELTPTPPIPQCKRIKIYDQEWVEIPYDRLSSLVPEQVIKITVCGEREGNFDKGRIRINRMEWTSENETTEQKPDSPGEFFIECEVGVTDEKATICGIGASPEDEFKIEGEVHDAITKEWR